MKKDDQIVISKSKLLKFLGIALGLVLCIGISFAVSVSNAEEYGKSSNAEESDEDGIYEEAVKNAAEVKDDERGEFHQISVDEYLELYKSSGKSIVLLSRPTCQYCQIATPILENIVYKYNAKLNYINTGELSDDDNSKLVSSDEYFKDGYGTPLVIVVGDSKIIDEIEGLTTKENYISFFKKYGWGE